jgi:hypothetical protein
VSAVGRPIKSSGETRRHVAIKVKIITQILISNYGKEISGRSRSKPEDKRF